MHYIKNPIVTEDQLRTFASNDYYIEAWQKRWKWNWGAFWLGGIFLLYRKMYIPFIIYLIASIFVLIVTSGMNLSTLEFRVLFMLLLNAPLAFFIDDIYLWHAEKKIEKIVKDNADGKLQNYHISRAGGSNFFIPFTVFFIAPICLTLLYFNLFE